MSTPRNSRLVEIEILEPLVLMSAAAADVEFDTLDDGTADSDLLLATEAGARVEGGEGADRLLAAAGSNALDGGPGDDLLYSLRGDNVLTGGTGNDTAVYLDGAVADYTVRDLGFGGIVEVTAGTRADLLYDVERISFRDGTFAVARLIEGVAGESIGLREQPPAADLDEGRLQEGSSNADVLVALQAGELLDGAGGADLLIAAAGDNELLGGADDDIFLTLRGRNIIDGQSGEDRISYQVSRADVFVTDRGDGSILIEGEDFTDSVRNVERFDFGGVIIDATDLEFDAATLLPVVVESPVSTTALTTDPLPEPIETDPSFEVTVGIPVEPDGGIGDGAKPLPLPEPLPFPIDEDGNLLPIPVEPDGGIGDGAAPLPVLIAEPQPVLIDVEGSPIPIPVEPGGGIGDGAGPIPTAVPISLDSGPIPVEPDGGIGDGAGPLVVTGAPADSPTQPFPAGIPIEVTPTFIPTIEGTDAGEWISGTAGDDVIVAGGGDDEIHVPVGNNQVDGGEGIDTLVIYEGYRAEYLFAVRSDGVTTISGPGLNGETATVDLLNVELILFNDGIVDLAGSSTVMPQPPTSGTAVIEGTDAGEWIGGTAGDDQISAGGGDDEIYVALGDNTIDGGEGIDTLLVYGNRADFTLQNTGDGRIYVEGPGLNEQIVRNTLTSIEQIRFADQTVLTADVPDLPVTIPPYPLPGDELATAVLSSAETPASPGEAESLSLVAASEPQVMTVEEDPVVTSTSGFGGMATDDFGMASLSEFLPDSRPDLVAVANAARELLETMDAEMTPAQLRTLFGEQLGIDLTRDDLRTGLNSMLRQVGFDLEAMLSSEDGFGDGLS